MFVSKKRYNDLEGQVGTLQDEIRKLTSVRNETISLQDVERLSDLFNIPSSASGKIVSQETAMRVGAVYACVRLIAGAIASTPLMIYESKEDDTRERDKSHPANSLLRKQPNPMITAQVYWETVVTHFLLAGNSYSLIGRNGAGRPLALTPLHPKRVEPDIKNDRLLYAVTFNDGKYAVYDQDDILHIPGVGWNGKKGLSVIANVGQNSFGGAMAADEYSSKFFANDATPRGVLKFPKKLSPDQAELILNYWVKQGQGLTDPHMPKIVTEGGEFQAITLSAEDTQLIETRQFNVVDIARIFGAPPHMIGSTEKTTSWGTGLEQQSLGFVIYTLNSHFTRITQEVDRKIIRDDNRYSEFLVAGLLRGDIKGRHESYQIAIGGNQQPGWMTVNEVRKLENLPPVSGGDVLYVPLTGEPADEQTS